MNIVNSHTLAEILRMKHRSLREIWREIPHFFVGQGRDLRAARFDADDVIDYLKTRDYKNECLVRQEAKTMGLQVLEGQNCHTGKAVF